MAGRAFGAVRKLPSGRYQARYFDGRGCRHAKTFRRKADANRWLADALVDLERGTWLDPKAGGVGLEGYVTQWMKDRPLAPRTRELYGDLLRLHVVPVFGSTPVSGIKPEAVRRWVGQMMRSNTPPPVTAAKCYRLLRAILNTAVEEGRIARNPCRVKGAGIERSPERPVASIEEVYALADTVRPRWRVMVLLATFTSLRLGEVLGLRRGDIDLEEGIVHVSVQLQELRSGGRIEGAPKSDGRRSVTIPPHLLDDLVAHLSAWTETGPEALVFTGVRGGPICRSFFNLEWRNAAAAVGMGNFHFHDLRHTGNTLAAATGASTKELMSRMGHSSSRAALIYQHATRDRDRAIANALSTMVTKPSGEGAA